MDPNRGPNKGPFVKIIEQPASKALRFRYECEGRSAGSIPGVNSTPENKTFPTIQIVGYKGRAVVIVSCVTKDFPYRPHPHNLVGREGCKNGVCVMHVNNDSMIASFPNLGIQCVKKKDIEGALQVREGLKVDPFNTGFAHAKQPGSIDLNAVRLSFQAFIPGPDPCRLNVPLMSVVSDTIYDKKAMSDLVICKLSECSSSVAGGREIILLCEKVAKEDISVRLFEERDGHIVWEGLGDFTPTQVHKQVAIAFRTPRYRTLEIENPVQVLIQLRRPSDGATSESLPFTLIPLDSDPNMKRKRKIPPNDSTMLIHLQERMQVDAGLAVKPEPLDSTSPHHYQPHLFIPSNYVHASRTPSPLDYQISAYSPGYQHTGPAIPQTPSMNYQPNRSTVPNNHQYSPIVEPYASPGVPDTYTPNMMGAQYQQIGIIHDTNPSVPSLDNIENIDFNSKELADVTLDNLPENLSSNLTLDENKNAQKTGGENMSDSFITRLTHDLCELNDM